MQCDMNRLERLARYLAGVSMIKVLFRHQAEDEAADITVYSDTDFAGCRETRKSTIGSDVVRCDVEFVVGTCRQARPTGMSHCTV